MIRPASGSPIAKTGRHDQSAGMRLKHVEVPRPTSSTGSNTRSFELNFDLSLRKCDFRRDARRVVEHGALAEASRFRKRPL